MQFYKLIDRQNDCLMISFFIACLEHRRVILQQLFLCSVPLIQNTTKGKVIPLRLIPLYYGTLVVALICSQNFFHLIWYNFQSSEHRELNRKCQLDMQLYWTIRTIKPQIQLLTSYAFLLVILHSSLVNLFFFYLITEISILMFSS